MGLGRNNERVLYYTAAADMEENVVVRKVLLDR